MPDETPKSAIPSLVTPAFEQPAVRALTPAATRALAEAEQRRAAAEAAKAALPPEKGGRNGPEPVRYGDWEKNGIISDF